MINIKADYKYETLFKRPFEITHCWTNGIVILKISAMNGRYNINFIKPDKYGTNVDNISS